MPIYEYECTACGHKLEALQKVSDAALTHCPECNRDHLQKLVSAAGFQLKGTGWYATDFKDKGKAPAKTVDSNSKQTADNKETKTETKTDTKTETKAETKKDTAAK